MISPRGWVDKLKLSGIKRIIKEDFPNEVQKWIDKLLLPFNNAISQFTYALTNQLTISENHLGSLKVLELSGASLITGDITAGSTQVIRATFFTDSIDQQYGVQVNQAVTGPGISPGTVISSINTLGSGIGVITLSRPATLTRYGVNLLAGGDFPFIFQNPINVKPQIVFLAKIQETSANPVTLAHAPVVQWYTDGTSITIQNITGLEAGRRYTVTLVVLAK
jgi:hypothetical protein